MALLIVFGHVRQSNRLEVLGALGELREERLDLCTLGARDLRREIVAEEVPVVGLALDGVHGHQVRRVLSIPQELEAHARGQGLLKQTTGLGLRSGGKSDNSVIGTLENSGVLVAGHRHEPDLAMRAHRMNVLPPGAEIEEFAGQRVSGRIKRRRHLLGKHPGHLDGVRERAGLGRCFLDLLPELRLLFLRWQGEVLFAAEVIVASVVLQFLQEQVFWLLFLSQIYGSDVLRGQGLGANLVAQGLELESGIIEIDQEGSGRLLFQVDQVRGLGE